jgi:hypothetical protein
VVPNTTPRVWQVMLVGGGCTLVELCARDHLTSAKMRFSAAFPWLQRDVDNQIATAAQVTPCPSCYPVYASVPFVSLVGVLAEIAEVELGHPARLVPRVLAVLEVRARPLVHQPGDPVELVEGIIGPRGTLRAVEVGPAVDDIPPAEVVENVVKADAKDYLRPLDVRCWCRRADARA